MEDDTPVLTPQQISAMFQDSMTWDRATMAEYQRLQLSQLLEHARNTVPFYKTRLDPLFRSDGSIDWSKWTSIPTVTRADLRDRGEELKTTAPIERHGRWHEKASSGSTGVPVTVTFTSFFIEIASYGWARFQDMQKFDFKAGANQFKIALPSHCPADAETYLKQAKRGKRPSLTILRTLPVPRKLELLCQSPFRALSDSANHAEILARENLRQGKPLSLSALECVGTGVTAEQQALYMESFGTRAISPYSSSEGALMAFQCPHGNDHFHVCSETVLLEVVDENGREVPVGGTGRTLVTPFFNSAQPLIRYEQGDLVVRGEGCSGLITLPTIREISGRKDSIFRFPGHEVAIFGLNVAELRAQLQADAYQIAQTGAQHLEVRYLSGSEASHTAILAVTTELRKFFGPEISLSFKRVSDIPFNAGGKQQRYVCEYAAD